VALLIYCSARNTAHVGDLYPASSSSSVCLVSCRIVAISTCSWPSQHFCFFRELHPLLVIVHPRPGSRHVVRPSVVMILLSATCHKSSSHTCDESRILTKPPAGISWSILSYLQWRFLLTKEARVICSHWHRGHFPPHSYAHELRTFFVNWVATMNG